MGIEIAEPLTLHEAAAMPLGLTDIYSHHGTRSQVPHTRLEQVMESLRLVR